MEKRSYEIFSGDVHVATWENDTLTVINEALLPLYLKKIQTPDIVNIVMSRYELVR